MFFKCFAKISAVVESGHERDIRDRLFCLKQKPLRLLHAVLNQVVHRCLVKRVFKRPDAFPGADAGVAGYVGNRYFS